MTSINQNKSSLLNISFTPDYESYEQNIYAGEAPQLISWNVTSWTWFYLEIKLNFTRPLQISSQTSRKDQIEIEFIQNNLFVAIKDGHTLE